MKKIFILLVVMMSLSASAQTQDKDIQKMQSSVSLEYGAKEEDGYYDKIGADIVYKHIVLGGSYGWGKSSDKDKYKTPQQFDVHVGGNYRYFIGGDLFYVEGRIVIGYKHYWQDQLLGTQREEHISGFGNREEIKVTEYDIWDTYGKGYFYVGATPRVGFNLKGYSVFAGYRWDFLDFKFDKEHNGDYFTIGVAKLF